MTLQWEYIHLEFNGSPAPEATSFEQKMRNSIEPKKIFLWLSDGSLEMIPLPNGNFGYHMEILKVLNQLGKKGWEAFDCKTSPFQEGWTLKRKLE
jgi:hypothetical protein